MSDAVSEVPGGGHTQTFRHGRGGLGINDSVLNLTNMEGYGDFVAAFMNNYIKREQLLGIAKIHGLYQGTAV